MKEEKTNKLWSLLTSKNRPADREIIRDTAAVLRSDRRDWSTANMVAPGTFSDERAWKGLLWHNPRLFRDGLRSGQIGVRSGRIYDSGGGTKQKRADPSTLMLPAVLTKLWQSTGSPAAFGVSRIMMSSGTLTHGPSIHSRLPLITSGRPKRAHQSLPRLSASVVWQSNTEQQLVWAGERTCGRRRLLYQGSSCGLLQSWPNADALVRRAAHGGTEHASIATNNRADIVVISINQADIASAPATHLVRDSPLGCRAGSERRYSGAVLS